MIPRLLVFLQFTGIFLVVVSGKVFPLHTPELLIAGFGLFLGLWAIYEQRPGNFNIAPINKEGARLIQSGPYKFIRHPMYLATILALAPVVVAHFNWLRMISALFLLLILILKLEYEEKHLPENFSEYPAYRKKTNKLIPFLY